MIGPGGTVVVLAETPGDAPSGGAVALGDGALGAYGDGGPANAAIGLLEEEGPFLMSATTGSEGIFYRRFDTATRRFGAAVLVSNEMTRTVSGSSDLDAAHDSAGDVYATWSDSRGTVLDYSSTAGASWRKPATIVLPASPDPDLVLAGDGGGSAELAYTADRGASKQVFVVPVSY